MDKFNPTIPSTYSRFFSSSNSRSSSNLCSGFVAQTLQWIDAVSISPCDVKVILLPLMATRASVVECQLASRSTCPPQKRKPPVASFLADEPPSITALAHRHCYRPRAALSLPEPSTGVVPPTLVEVCTQSSWMERAALFLLGGEGGAAFMTVAAVRGWLPVRFARCLVDMCGRRLNSRSCVIVGAAAHRERFLCSAARGALGEVGARKPGNNTRTTTRTEMCFEGFARVCSCVALHAYAMCIVCLLIRDSPN